MNTICLYVLSISVLSLNVYLFNKFDRILTQGEYQAHIRQQQLIGALILNQEVQVLHQINQMEILTTLGPAAAQRHPTQNRIMPHLWLLRRLEEAQESQNIKNCNQS